MFSTNLSGINKHIHLKSIHTSINTHICLYILQRNNLVKNVVDDSRLQNFKMINLSLLITFHYELNCNEYYKNQIIGIIQLNTKQKFFRIHLV